MIFCTLHAHASSALENVTHFYTVTHVVMAYHLLLYTRLKEYNAVSKPYVYSVLPLIKVFCCCCCCFPCLFVRFLISSISFEHFALM